MLNRACAIAPLFIELRKRNFHHTTERFYTKTYTKKSYNPRPLGATRGRLVSFISWLFIGHGVALFVGTTGIASIYLLLANSLQIQEYIAERIGRHLSKSTGLQVNFSSAIVPNWKSGRIVFNEVLVQRLPNPAAQPGSTEDNFTRFRLSIEKIETSISLWRWVCGRGLVESASFHGVRGVIDRSALFPASPHKHLHKWGDFDLQDCSIKDALVSVDNGSRAPSYALSIYQAYMPRLRKHWLFYDILNSDSVLGLYDNSLFSYQKPQRQDPVLKEELNHLRRLKIDNVKSQHFTGLRAPLWKMITRGTIDLDVFVRLDHEEHKAEKIFSGDRVKSLLISIFEDSLKESSSLFFSEDSPHIYQHSSSPLVEFAQKIRGFIQQKPETIKEAKEIAETEKSANYFLSVPPTELAFKVSLALRNIKANPTDGSFWVRPVANYLNESKSLIKIDCNFSIPRADFAGYWNLHDCGLSGALAGAVSQSLSEAAADRTRQIARLKKVGLWSLYSLWKSIESETSSGSSPVSNYSNYLFSIT